MMIDVTDATFQTDVLERSMQTPVVVDLWAPWCGPCKTLGPMIEKIVDETDGAVVLAKVNVDENPGLSQAFQVQSIPAMHIIDKGQVVNSIIGAQPEPVLREFVASVAPTTAELATADLLAKGDEESLLEILATDRGHVEAILKLSQLWVDAGRNDEALELLSRIPETEQVRHIAALARVGADAAQAAEDEIVGQLAELLTTVKTDDDARKKFVDLLEVLGAENPTTAVWRKKLTTQLF
ncbi:MAG: thioredoxin [Acidimicrobiales bacterium]